MLSVPNLLSLSRIPLAAVLALCIASAWWPAALAIFALAALTDWIDGWWARRFNQQSALGRSLDPLTDKVLVAVAFIFLQSAGVGVQPWMVAVVIARELLVTGLRGMVEAAGQRFGADWFGKLKTVLQMLAIAAILAGQSLGHEWLRLAAAVLLYAAIIATIGSGVQYCIKAAKLISSHAKTTTTN